MRRENIKRVFFSCTVFLLLFYNFTSLSFAYSDPPYSAYSSDYMPVCPLFSTSSQLPYGDNTLVICYVPPAGQSNRDYYYEWFFVDMSHNSTDHGFNIEDYTYLPYIYNSRYVLHLQCWNKIYHYYSPTHNNNNWSYSTIGQWSSDNSYYSAYNYSLSQSYTTGKIVSNFIPRYAGMTVAKANQLGVFPSFNGNLTDTYLASYPNNVAVAIDSISEQTALLSQYYNTLNNKLNSLSSDHVVLSNQISELQSQVNNQGGEFQSQLDEAQSEIISNANEQVSQAVDDINNAGEDISDIDNDVDDVNDIVDTLDEWVSSLDDFADRIGTAEQGVAQALENGKTLMNGFLGVCPPIVIALITFALVFLVVRKIIGR